MEHRKILVVPVQEGITVKACQVHVKRTCICTFFATKDLQVQRCKNRCVLSYPSVVAEKMHTTTEKKEESSKIISTNLMLDFIL